MSESTRRDFLVMAGAGAAAAGLTAAVPAAAEAAPAHPGPLVAYVKDAATGEVSVMAGDREVVVRDRALVNRIAQAAR